MLAERLSNSELKEAFTNLIDNYGPGIEDYPRVNELMATLAKRVKSKNLPEQELREIVKTCEFLNDEKTIMGHIKRKPFGYAGDFKIIDRIYLKDNSEGHFEKWDNFSLECTAARAVRNRKEYFKKQLLQEIEKKGKIKLLNVASGPARDVLELYDSLEDKEKVRTTCIEKDNQAIAYAKGLTSKYSQYISFINVNIFKYKPTEKFDVIWSAGLFDYFSDKAFLKVLSTLKECLKEDGKIIIGNFSQEHNPSRAYMELIGEWYLEHRTENQLLALAKQAGFNEHNFYVGSEEEKVNLFLHISKN
jgi:extracellular factor (EF) 3-hydroxypalmitic acid methyl ester biosynthesis protein